MKLSDIRVGDKVPVTCFSGLGTGGAEEVTEVPRTEIHCGNHRFDRRTGVALNPPTHYFLEGEEGEAEDLVSAEQKIEDYFTSIGLGGLYSEAGAEALIASHKRLRELNGGLQQLRQEAFNQGLEEGRQYALENNYFSVERLRSMTLGELTQLLAK